MSISIASRKFEPSAAVSAVDWLPLDPPGHDGGVVLPFAGLNGSGGSSDIGLQTGIVPEPVGLVLLAAGALLLRRKRDMSVKSF